MSLWVDLCCVDVFPCVHLFRPVIIVDTKLQSKVVCPHRSWLFFKGEGHSRNGVFFEIANKKVTLSWVTDHGFSF